MEDSARQAKNAYMRDYYKNNKEKVKAAQQRYWEKKANQESDKRGMN